VKASKNIVRFALAALLLALCVSAEAQQPKKQPRIGILFPSTAGTTTHLLDAFRQGLREFGYIEGENLLLEPRYAEAKAERVPVFATELVRLKVDLIVAVTNPCDRGGKASDSDNSDCHPKQH
jgi:putative ABC transport system substrate-binding protein